MITAIVLLILLLLANLSWLAGTNTTWKWPRRALTKLVMTYRTLTGSPRNPRSHDSDTFDTDNTPSNAEIIAEITSLSEQHEIASALTSLIRTDGAGSWPPHANYAVDTWPAPLRPYWAVFWAMQPLFVTGVPSLDDEVNRAKMGRFRAEFRRRLREGVDLDAVEGVLRAAEDGRWDLVGRDVYNAFYCTVATLRHMYRWATFPVVRLAQLEKTILLPPELVSPWTSLQAHFGLHSQSGNMAANMVLNFDASEAQVFLINRGLSDQILGAERAFNRIMREVEGFGVPAYRAMVHATLAFARRDATACARHVEQLVYLVGPALRAYFSRMHEGVIARAAWLPHVQGFFAWGVGETARTDEEGTDEWRKYDGLSGNQVFVFVALDAFLGIAPYLDDEMQRQVIPARQREVGRAFAKHSFRSRLAELGDPAGEERIRAGFEEVVKRLKLFRVTHRMRAKVYLTQPAPERLPMTAGKSLLKDDMETSLVYLDHFMLGRISQTV